MSKPILPYNLRVKITELDEQGYSTDQIEEMLYDEAKSYLKPNQSLKRCIASIKGQRTKGYKPRK